jgi:hypothetical protein
MIADPASGWALMSSIIPELGDNLSKCGETIAGNDKPQDAFA